MRKLLLGLLVGAGALAADFPLQSPVNDAFVVWQMEKTSVQAGATASSNALPGGGVLPEPFPPEIHSDYAFLPADMQPVGAAATDARYDMRDPNGDGNTSDSLLTSVKDQVYGGPCWAHAVMATVESYIKAHEGTTYDFSEDHMAHAHGFDWGPTDGGNFALGVAMFSRYDAPVSESDDPYDTFDANGDYLANAETPCTTCKPQRYVDNAIFLPSRANTADNAYIKQAILDHGVIYATFQTSGSSYDWDTNTYYYGDNDTSSRESDHAIAIVGWDDNHVSTHNGFMHVGAFIVKNSWGDFGEDGFIYIAYDDDSLAFGTVGYIQDEPESDVSFDNVYTYAEFGMTGGVGYGTATAYAANVFTAEKDETLTAVGTYIYDTTTDIEITVYGTVNGSSFSDPLADTLTQSGLERGFHTFVLPDALALAKDQTFAIVIKYTSHAASPWPLAKEDRINGYTSAASANAGESYISSSGTSWTDLTNYYPNSSFTISALTKRSDAPDDFNQDGDSDLIFFNAPLGYMKGWEMDGALGGFTNRWMQNLGASDWEVFPHYSDLDGDGNLDIVIRKTSSGNIKAIALNGFSVLSMPLLGAPGETWEIAGISDIDQNGYPDILLQDTTRGYLKAIKLSENFTSGGYVWIGSTGGVDKQVVAVEDLDGDGTDDLLVRDQTNGALSALKMGTDFTITSKAIYDMSGLDWQLIGVADMNEDGMQDIVLQNSANGYIVAIELGSDFVGTRRWITNPGGADRQVVAIADVDGDGHRDLVLQNTSVGLVTAYKMDGSYGAVYKRIGHPYDVNFKVVSVRDYDHDGIMDILVQNTQTGYVKAFKVNSAFESTYSWLGSSGGSDWKLVHP